MTHTLSQRGDAKADATYTAYDIEVRGVVQGVGFRPFVAGLARRYGLSGEVGNDELSVFITVEGFTHAVHDFISAITSEAPVLASILSVSVTEIAVAGRSGFTIVDSRHRPGQRTLVPPDVAVCDDCIAEMTDPLNRRYHHPFITCTQCGPRFTIITDLPYDRPATTMANFALCPACAAEYGEPTDRRYHAQPISCHECGPTLWWHTSTQSQDDTETVSGTSSALRAAAAALGRGAIVAIKGIGGFHLACNAADARAVARLRELKHRPAKPFAVMARDIATVEKIAVTTSQSLAAATSPARPIVVMPARPEAVGPCLATEVMPQLDEVGVMLPYAPLHYLLFGALATETEIDTLVMTSGNLAEEPLCYTNEDAVARLSGVAEGFLLHDRDIAVPCEDSVVTIVDGHEVPIRRSRGFAPLPLLLDEGDEVGQESVAVLAVGAEVKNTFCVVAHGLAHVSAHLGDMATVETQRAFAGSVSQLLRLRGVRPTVVAADQHPGYLSGQWASRFADEQQAELILVQHHHAHLVSLLAEQHCLGESVLGLTFDGTGYGCDRQIWGGEFLRIGSDITTFERVGHLRSFGLPGGEAAVRNPYRIAMSLLTEAGCEPDWQPPASEQIRPTEYDVVRAQLATGTGVVNTTSMGRLWDGIAALLGVSARISYEAQAAIELESLARSAHAPVELPVEIRDAQLDWRPLVRELMALRTRKDRADLALGFHHAMARAAAELAHRIGTETVGLTGGVFANRILTDCLSADLVRRGHRVLQHRRIPCNDGGISVGQAVVAQAVRARTRAGGEERGSGTCV